MTIHIHPLILHLLHSLTLVGNSFTIPFEMTAGTEDTDKSLTVIACGLIPPNAADSLAVTISN